MGELSVYKKMTLGPADLFSVLKQEIGVKSTCMPFAAKAIAALKTLPNLTESEAMKAADTFLSDLQTLNQGGITAEDYDKIDFIKRGKVITISARVEAFYRAAARKGYRITDTIVPVPKDDASTTYFKENFHNGKIVYTLEDKRLNADRKITAERLIAGYFNKFILRLDIADIKTNKRLVMIVCEMTNEEMLTVSAVSEGSVYKTQWEKYTDRYENQKNRKVVMEEINPDPNAFWIKWTRDMVEKSIVRKSLKRVREVLPEIKEAIYAFDRDDAEYVTVEENNLPVEIPMESVDVDLKHLTEQQKSEAMETLELFTANPKLAIDKAQEIKEMFEGGASVQEVVNVHYASLVNIKKSKKLYPAIKPYFEVKP